MPNEVYTNAVYFAKLSSKGVGTWKKTTSYPTNLAFQSCLASGGYIYCVGGITPLGNGGAVYFAKLSSTGVGTWKKTTSYPTNIEQQSCVVSGGYIYCVGGYPGSPVVDFAKLSSSGVGAWTATTDYPTTIEDQSCFVSGNYVFCLGGYAGGIAIIADVFSAKLSSSGVGAWTATTEYPLPIQNQSCVVSGRYVYCVGGWAGSAYTNAVYFASV